MRLFYLVTKPLVDLFNGMGNLLLKPFGIPPASEAGHAPHSEEELRTIMRQARGRGDRPGGPGAHRERVLLRGPARA